MFSPRMRTDFSREDDILLTKFIATYNPAKHGRSGNALYLCLVDNASFPQVLYWETSLMSLQVDGKWNWSKKHSWQSWRNRYAKNSDEFDRKILKYQKKKGINTGEKTLMEKSVPLPPDAQEEAARAPSKEMKQGTKRAGAKVSPQQRKAKRAKLETNQPDGGSRRLPLIDVEAKTQNPAAGSSHQARSPPSVQEQSEYVSDVPPLAPKPASTVNVPLLPAGSDTLPLPSSQPDSPVRSQLPTTSQLPPSSEPLASSSQQVGTPKLPHSGRKRVLEPKLVSPPFRSFSPSPNLTSSNKKKTLAKVVEGHFTTSLTDRLGRVPLGDRSESENGETRVWPPVRGMKGKIKDAVPGLTAVSSSAVHECECHPINRIKTLTSRPAPVPPKHEREDQHLPLPAPLHRLEPEHHAFRQVQFPLPPPPPPHDRSDADAAESPLKHRSTNGMHQLASNLRDSAPGSVTGPSKSGLSLTPPIGQPTAGPSKLTSAAVPSGPTLTAKPPPEPAVVVSHALPTSEKNARLMSASMLARSSAGSTSSTMTAVQQTRVSSKGSSKAATDVPLPERDSRLALPVLRRSNIHLLPEPSPLSISSNQKKDKGKGKGYDAEPPLTHAQRLLARTRKQRRRQTVGGYEYDDVPSINLTRAPSAASTSRIPRSSTPAPALRLPHRYSLPSKSAPSALPADLSGYLTSLDQPGPAMLPVPPALITPADIPLFVSVGFNTLVSRIAAVHGYAPSVVLELYKHLGNLKEVDEFMKAMRNNSEEWAGAELERRKRETRRAGRISKGRKNNDSESSSSESSSESSVERSENGGDAPSGSRHGRLQPAPLEHRTPNGLHVRYVPPPDESDYEPPPTTRAAWWKRTSMGGGGSLSGSWGTSATGRYRTKENEAAEYKMEEDEDTIGSSEGGDDGFASEEDEESEADFERAEEESVVDELFPESPDPESDPEQDAENENKDGADSQQLNQDGYQHHEFSQAHAPCHHPYIKRESQTPPRLHGDFIRIPAHNGTGVLDDMSDDCTRSVSRPWDADEDRHLFSAHWDTLKMLEKQRETVGMTRRIVQLLR